VAGNTRTWTEAHVRRLFWRAGFGPTPREVSHWTRAGRERAIAHVVHGPRRGASLLGARPTVKGRPIDPLNEYGHEVLWWLDRMVRSTWPLQEKLTLFWHDHFATRDQDTPLMLRQNRMLRTYGMGSFRRLLRQVTRDPAMQLFLSLADSHKDSPNENYARELMELFTLGEGYTEGDIREASRALTGWRVSRTDGQVTGTWFDRERYDEGVKRILGQRGRFGTQEVLDIVVERPRHAPFLVTKLWEFFITEPIDRASKRELVRTYRRSGLRILPVVEGILRHPALYARLDAPDMVKCPLVYVAGILRAARKPVTNDGFTWMLSNMGQVPFRPPSVAGWDWGPTWMTSGTIRARLDAANMLISWGEPAVLEVPDTAGRPDLTPSQQVDLALSALGDPWISEATRGILRNVAAHYFDDLTRPWQQDEERVVRAAMLQRTLRNLLISGPDAHLH
jgi:Protein of unknown function (DUF1800)